MFYNCHHFIINLQLFDCSTFRLVTGFIYGDTQVMKQDEYYNKQNRIRSKLLLQLFFI